MKRLLSCPPSPDWPALRQAFVPELEMLREGAGLWIGLAPTHGASKFKATDRVFSF
jgi:hypothetical protein